MKKTRVVVVITGLAAGGAESMLLKLMQHIDRKRFEITVISLTTAGVIGPRIEALGIPVYAFSMRSGFPSPLKFMQLINKIREIGPDLVHTWMYHADLLGGLAARLAGIRSLAWGIRHSDLSVDKNKQSTLRVVGMCARLSKLLPRAILSCSERAKRIHIEAGYCAEKFSVISNGFDLSQFLPYPKARESVRAELKLNSDVLLVGLLARFHPQKNHEGFIQAAQEVSQALPNVHFVLAGSEVDSTNLHLMSLIEKTGMSMRFHLLGRRDDVPRLMASLDILASTSWGEAFPNVLGEAMACGVPCVVTDVGDSAEIVGDTGRVVAPGDMDGLAHHLIELLGQPSLRDVLGQRGRQRVQDRYEIGAITRQYENFYLRLLESD